MKWLSALMTERPRLLFAVVTLAVALLPVCVWLDLNSMSHNNLHRQATGVNGLLNSVRSYYSANVVARVLGSDDETVALHDYRTVDGAIPIPATLSIELGEAISEQNRGLAYRFVSDHPFSNREDYELTAFETDALKIFRDETDTRDMLIDEIGNIFDHQMFLATPVRMAQTCVDCHNSHVNSPKRDWQIGDVRGLQIVHVRQPIALNLFSFKFLLAYLAVAGTMGFLFAIHQLRLAEKFRTANDELTANNTFLADVSAKISKYLEPQVYKSIFAGERDVAISTERKKLTVFFSDIKDFTATTERMQPEELTSLLNKYFSEMSLIAKDHGATIDKFIGDAIVAFFGDPSTHGPAEDARACVRMALDMQKRLDELEDVWRSDGVEHPFRARMGINTGYCNVGNFGSDSRMDYTIIGAEANLAARLESIAEPGGIVMSYETYAHVRDLIDAEPLEPRHVKGISREITPYKVLRPAPDQPKSRTREDSERLVVDLHGMDERTKREISAAVDAALAGRQASSD
ncbi:adenylate/guanylate cyclase domain-containing protein [Shimia sp.]|uniref:adenylate/guanylate cyclase domain-containing protein n=1 Tax=Shimia sp. TaxID=1954381 RepID=UPI003296FBF0